VVNGALVFPVEKWTAEHQGTAFAALHAAALPDLQLPVHVFRIQVIKKNSS
jgi:hypothetical protein